MSGIGAGGGARRGVDRSRSGRSGFARVYEEHVWRVYGFFAYRMPDRAAAEDLTQATFERALAAWPRFDPARASEATWLLAIARNLLIDHHRRDRSGLHTGLDEHPDAAQLAAPPDRHELGLDPDLAAALAALPERERTVLALRFGGDLSGPQIAAELDLTLANVQQIISRTLRRLRERLDAAARART